MKSIIIMTFTFQFCLFKKVWGMEYIVTATKNQITKKLEQWQIEEGAT
jgi:hypothetical protein